MPTGRGGRVGISAKETPENGTRSPMRAGQRIDAGSTYSTGVGGMMLARRMGGR